MHDPFDARLLAILERLHGFLGKILCGLRRILERHVDTGLFKSLFEGQLLLSRSTKAHGFEHDAGNILAEARCLLRGALGIIFCLGKCLRESLRCKLLCFWSCGMAE